MADNVNGVAPTLEKPSLGDRIQNVLGEKWKTVLIWLLVCIAIAAIAAMYIYHLLKKGRIGKSISFPLQGANTPLSGSTLTKLKAGTMPGNAEETTMSFWIYVESFERWAGALRHVLHRGKDTVDPLEAGPLVYLDKSGNKMHVSFRPKDPGTAFKNTTIPTGKSAAEREKQLEYIRKTHGITIDYLPAQRWVHVAITASTRNNMIKAYIDGEEVKTASGRDRGVMEWRDADKALQVVKHRFDVKNADILGTGDFYIGGATSSMVGVGFAGLVSNVKFFDYALNKTEIYNVYRQGPIENMLAKLGLPVYGVQSPIYRISSTSP